MFLIIGNGRHIVETVSTFDDALARATDYRDAYDYVAIAEIILGDSRTVTDAKIPTELARAVEQWNAMCARLPVTVPKVRTAGKYLAPYRRWKRENRDRTYVLEKLVDDVERQAWTHPWVTFGWLFGKKNGEPNSEKLRNGKFNGPRRNDSRLGTRDDEFSPTER